jgi:4a-hydroxytetrahydrobiopterin dehydratase
VQDLGIDASDLAGERLYPLERRRAALEGTGIADTARATRQRLQVVNEHHLEKEYSFKNFREAFDFTNRVGDLAERQKHHPDIHLARGKVKLTTSSMVWPSLA